MSIIISLLTDTIISSKLEISSTNNEFKIKLNNTMFKINSYKSLVKYLRIFVDSILLDTKHGATEVQWTIPGFITTSVTIQDLFSDKVSNVLYDSIDLYYNNMSELVVSDKSTADTENKTTSILHTEQPSKQITEIQGIVDDIGTNLNDEDTNGISINQPSTLDVAFKETSVYKDAITAGLLTELHTPINMTPYPSRFVPTSVPIKIYSTLDSTVFNQEVNC